MRPTDQNVCGPRVKEARVLRGLTQEQLAAQVSVCAGELGMTDWDASRGNIQSLESRNVRVTDAMLLALSIALGADMRWLVGHPDGTPPKQPKRKK